MTARRVNRLRYAVATGAAVGLFGSTAGAQYCPADLDGDGQVHMFDLLELLSAWGPNPGHPADFNFDGMVDGPDLVYLLASWGPCPSEPEPGELELFDATIAVNVTDDDARELGLIVTNLYATGDQVAIGDALFLVDDADIVIENSSCYEHWAGTDTPPDGMMIDLFPELRYDTFLTINRLQDDPDTTLVPGTAIVSNQIIGGWFAVPEGQEQRQAVDISELTGIPDQAGVLIAQITLVPGAASELRSYSGTVRLYTAPENGGSLEGIEAQVEFLHDDCPADMDATGFVGISDLVDLLAAWGSNPGGPPDFDFDGAVDVYDLVFLLASWGECPAEPLPGNVELFDAALAIDVTDGDAAALGYTVTHLYATGAELEVGHSLLLSALADITPQNAIFFQHPAGDALPPDGWMIDLFPELEYDTFFAMNLLQDDSNTFLVPESQMTDVLIEGGSFVAPDVVQRQAVDLSGITCVANQAGVLIAQITLDALSELPVSYGGTIRLFTSSLDGGSLQGVDVEIFFPCAGDTNGDGVVSTIDLLNLLAAWNVGPGCVADIDGNGVVKTGDLLALLVNWGPCP